MKNKILALFLLLPIVVLALVSLNFEKARTGKIVYVAAVGFDPRDILSGRYIYLRLNFANTDCSQFPQNICPQEAFHPTYRYYLPQAYADQAQELIQKENPSMALVFFYTPYRKAVLKDWYINGKPWQETIKKH